MPRARVTQPLEDKNIPGEFGSGVQQEEANAIIAQVDQALTAGTSVAQQPPQQAPPAPTEPPPGAFNRPSERQGEPITAGLSTGAGVGAPPAISEEDINQLQARAYALEALVARPGASRANRALYHKIRAILLSAGRSA